MRAKSKKAKAIVKFMEFPIYQTHAYAVMHGEPKACLDKFERRLNVAPEIRQHIEESCKGAWGLTYELVSDKGNKLLVVWLSPELDLKTPKGLSTVVHECFHVAHRILQCVGGMVLQDTNEEAYAHFLGYVFKHTLGAIKE